MQAIEFSTKLNQVDSIQLPEQALNVFKIGTNLKIIILYDDNEEEAWSGISTHAFFDGYADTDSIYDNM